MMMAEMKSELWEWAKAIIVAVLLAVGIRYFLLEPIVVDGFSMMPTLHNQDRMIVNKIGTPKRFDIIVFHASETQDYIKRVIGLPGDRIEYKNDILYVNGKKYEERYLDKYKKQLKKKFENDELLTENFTLKDLIDRETVPNGTLFVMGDNRRGSKDSRRIGVIPMENVIGKTKLIYWPTKDFRIIK